MRPTLFTLLLALVIPFLPGSSRGDDLSLQFRKQVEVENRHEALPHPHDPGHVGREENRRDLCDMWDDHYCRNSARVSPRWPAHERGGEKGPRRRSLIIHCPSGCMNFYAETPQRKLAQSARGLGTTIPLEGWCHLDSRSEPEMPVKSDQLRRLRRTARQGPLLQPPDRNPRDRAGGRHLRIDEAFFLMKHRGVENVLIMGVHTTCACSAAPSDPPARAPGHERRPRPRHDRLDVQSAEPPYVNHFTGNDLILSHVERHWCPTVTSGRSSATPRLPLSRRHRPHIRHGDGGGRITRPRKPCRRSPSRNSEKRSRSARSTGMRRTATRCPASIS